MQTDISVSILRCEIYIAMAMASCTGEGVTITMYFTEAHGTTITIILYIQQRLGC